MRTDELDFELPSELIAQAPAVERAASRLMHYARASGAIEHRAFAELPSLLRRGDLLVFNDAKVLPARFTLKKRSGGIVEALYVGPSQQGDWLVLLKNVGPVRGGGVDLYFADEPGLHARAIEKLERGEYRLRVDSDRTAADILARHGRMPLPPYIRRDKQHDRRDAFDRERYQTVFAKQSGSIAAPTAGLHFTDSLFAQLESAGIERTFVTLHVGIGTFRPVEAEELSAHPMHVERYSISSDAADSLNRAKSDGRRIVAVGTTAARVLESQPAATPFAQKDGETSIFIYPPYEWKHVAALITNFHLPRSTLIALVAATVGLDVQRKIYRTAIEDRYRFFSYGDAMFVE